MAGFAPSTFGRVSSVDRGSETSRTAPGSRVPRDRRSPVTAVSVRKAETIRPAEPATELLRSAAICLLGPLQLTTHNHTVLGESLLPAVALELGVHVLLLGIADAEIGD